MIFDTMQHVFKMDMVDLGPLSLKEAIIETGEGIKAGQDYGKAVRGQNNGIGRKCDPFFSKTVPSISGNATKRPKTLWRFPAWVYTGIFGS